ncbi:MAG: hypothetical protein ACFE91_06075 [Promethearchaeota archaeon]
MISQAKTSPTSAGNVVSPMVIAPSTLAIKKGRIRHTLSAIITALL